MSCSLDVCCVSRSEHELEEVSPAIEESKPPAVDEPLLVFVQCRADEASGSWTRWALYGPVVCDVVVGLTVLTFGLCGLLSAIALDNGETWFDGFPTPPLSLTGRDPPQYYVFAGGLSFCAVGFFGAILLYCAWVSHLYSCTQLTIPRCSTLWCCFCCGGSKMQWAIFVAAVACSNLAILAVSNFRLSTLSEFLLLVHLYSTIIMLITAAMTMFILNQLIQHVSESIPKEAGTADLTTFLTTTLAWKNRYSRCFLCIALLHIIPAYVVVPGTVDIRRMSMHECEQDRALQSSYCEYYVNTEDHNMTVLLDLSSEPQVLITPVTQYIVIAALLGYVWLLRYDFVFFCSQQTVV